MAQIEAETLPKESQDNLLGEISGSYKLLREISLRPGGLKNGEELFSVAADRINSHPAEAGSLVIDKMPQVLWTNMEGEKPLNTDGAISIGRKCANETFKKNLDSEEESEGKLSKPKPAFALIGLGEGWICAKEFAQMLEVSSGYLDMIIRKNRSRLTMNPFQNSPRYFLR